MPLYDQSTNLAAQGKFAPGVNYRADVRMPTQKMPEFPKGQYQFNIDLNSIGKALAQMSRDQADVEETKFKLEYAKKEKADAAAEKQLKINTSNALAQEIADVTAQLDQGIINPLTASRMQKEIKDRYRAMGILDASAIATTVKAEDGGASTFLEKRREQYGNWELSEKTNRLSDIHSKVPSSNNLSDAEALNMSYNIEQAGIRAAASVVNNNSNSGTGEAASLSYMTLMRDGQDAAVYQAATTLGNISSSGTKMAPSQMLQNAYENTFRYYKGIGASDEVSLAMANSAMDKLKPYTKMIQDGTKEEKEYWEQLAQSGKYQRQVMFHQMFPVQAWAAENKGVDFSNYGVDYAGFNKELGELGPIVLPSASQNTANIYQQTQTGFVSQQVPVSYTFPNGLTVPFSQESAFVANHPKEYLLSVASGQMPVGAHIGRPVAMGLVSTAAYNPNMNLSGGEIQGKSQQELKIAANNSKSFYNVINSATGTNNLTKQGQFDGIDYTNVLNSYNTADGVEIMSNDPDTWNEIYRQHGAPVQDSNYLYSFLRVAPDGSLMMKPIKGYVNSFVDVLTGEEFKKHVAAINESTQGFDPNTRASLSRALVNKRGQGVPNADPNTDTVLSNKVDIKESVGAGAVKAFKFVNKFVNEKIVPAEEAYVNTIEKEGVQPFIEKFDEWYKDVAEPAVKDFVEEKGYDVKKSYEQYLKDNNLQDSARARQDFVITSSFVALKEIADKVKDKANTYDENFEPEETFTLPEPAGGIEDVLKQANTDKDIDLKKGSIDFTKPNALSLVVEDGGNSWASIKFATISDDGRTYVVPTITETGEPSTAKKEFEKGRTLLSVKGTDEESTARAEYFGQKVREYLIERDTPEAEARMAEVRNASSISGGGVQEIVDKIKQSKKIPENKKTPLILDLTEAFGEGMDEGLIKTGEKIADITSEYMPLAKALAFREIANKYDLVDANQMLEDTNTNIITRLGINLGYGGSLGIEAAYNFIKWVLFDSADIKPVTYLRKAYREDESGLLDATAAMFFDGEAREREKLKLKKAIDDYINLSTEYDPSYLQNTGLGIN